MLSSERKNIASGISSINTISIGKNEWGLEIACNNHKSVEIHGSNGNEAPWENLWQRLADMVEEATLS